MSSAIMLRNAWENGQIGMDAMLNSFPALKSCSVQFVFTMGFQKMLMKSQKFTTEGGRVRSMAWDEIVKKPNLNQSNALSVG